MTRVTFDIPGEPLPKARPRVVRGRAHTPTRTRAWERTVGWAALAAMQGRDPLAGDVAMWLHFRRKNRQRADLDNLVKAIADGANGILWHDDKQIVELHATVEYASECPGVAVDVRALLAA